VVKNDGPYSSASDFYEDTLALFAADHAGDKGTPEEHIDAGDIEYYECLIVQCVLCAQTKCVIKERSCRMIFDGGSCNNLASSDMMEKLALSTKSHPHPYHIQWLNNSGKVKVMRLVRINFAIGSYHDVVECDVVPMQACHILLGRPWQFDTGCVHHGRSNQFSLLHHDKKIVLLPMTPEAIVHDDIVRAAKAKRENNKIVKSVANKKDEIRLKGICLLATKSDINELSDATSVAYTLVCKDDLISIHDMQHSLHPAIANIL
jgi:hypothetical protein